MKQRGLVLLLILILLPMGLLMLLLNWQAAAKLQQGWVMEQTLLKEEGRQQLALQTFEQNLAANLACLLPPGEVSGGHDLTWWQDHGCSFEWAGANYYAVISDLGLNACLGAHFYRVNLLSASLKQRAIERVLESVYAIAEGDAKPCAADNRFQWGRQHWRLA